MEHIVNIVNSTRRNNKVFLDNGFISNPKLNANWIFSQYQEVTDKIYNPQNLSIVLPDSLDPETAVNILSTHKRQILELCDRYVRVILPIHDYGNSKEQRDYVHKMLEVLEFHPNITAGIPSLKARSYSLAKVQTILSVKKPDGTNAFTGVHFLGLAKTKNTRVRYGRRLLIAQLMGMTEISFDSNRSQRALGE